MHNAILVFVRWFQLQSLWIIVSRPGCARCAWDLSSCSRSRLTSCSNALRQALARSWQRQNSTPQNAPESADDSPSFRCDSLESYGLIWHEKSRRFVATSKGLHNTLEGARLHHRIIYLWKEMRDCETMIVWCIFFFKLQLLVFDVCQSISFFKRCVATWGNSPRRPSRGWHHWKAQRTSWLKGSASSFSPQRPTGHGRISAGFSCLVWGRSHLIYLTW